MNDDGLQFALSCKDSNAPAPVLVDVQAQGRLDAVLFELTLRQTYRNTSRSGAGSHLHVSAPPRRCCLASHRSSTASAKKA
jgi:hypothetical protein